MSDMDGARSGGPPQHLYELPYHWCMGAFYKYVIGIAVDRVRHLLDGKVVVDAGCGDGFTAALLRAHAEYVVGFDLNERAVRFAEMIVGTPDTKFVLGRAGDVASIAHREGIAPDVITAFEVIEHLDHDETARFLSGASEVLSSGGHLILTTPNGLRGRNGTNPYHSHEYSPRELVELLTSAGWQDVTLEGLYLQPRWKRLEHFADVVPFRALFRRLARTGRSRPHVCRTLLVVARSGPGSAVNQ